MKEVDKKRTQDVSGGYFGPLETESPLPIGPTPTFPEPPPITPEGDATNKL
jgi:hypothetical protein